VILLFAITVGLVLLHHSSAKTNFIPSVERSTKASVAPQYTSLQGRYLINGTIFWGRAIERVSLAANDFGYTLRNLSTFNPSAYDAWIADLECPVANMTVPYQRQVDLLSFNCLPEFAPAYVKYFQIIGLANNHTGNQGQAAFLETQQNLTAAGAQVYGSYDPSDAQNRCEVISLPIKLQRSDGQQSKSALPVAFCGFHYVGRMPLPGELEYITQYAKIMPTIATVHMGIEYTAQATPNQVTVAHGLIDAGADFVVMNHPHWVQNTEVYKGKLIMYSVGNFIFDQLTAEELRSASLDVTMNIPYNQNLAKWLALNNSCKAIELHDNCLAAAQAAHLQKPKVKYTFALVVGDSLTDQWVPQKANPTIQQAVEQRTNWADTIKKLQSGE